MAFLRNVGNYPTTWRHPAEDFYILIVTCLLKNRVHLRWSRIGTCTWETIIMCRILLKLLIIPSLVTSRSWDGNTKMNIREMCRAVTKQIEFEHESWPVWSLVTAVSKICFMSSIRFHEYICPEDGRRSFIRKLTITYQITHCHIPIDQSPPRLHVLTTQ
jgi:hypothetical protein